MLQAQGYGMKSGGGERVIAVSGGPLPITPRRESVSTVLARNLVIARQVRGVTQQELAAESGVSRATIAQLETGISDPRLSTVTELAAALGIPPMLLMAGNLEVRLLSQLPHELTSHPVPVPGPELARMRELVTSGLHKDRDRAARLGASVARAAGAAGTAATIAAALFSVVLPGDGTSAGAALGRLFESK